MAKSRVTYPNGYTPHEHIRPVIEADDSKRVVVALPRMPQLPEQWCRQRPVLMLVENASGYVEYTTQAQMRPVEARLFAEAIQA